MYSSIIYSRVIMYCNIIIYEYYYVPIIDIIIVYYFYLIVVVIYNRYLYTYKYYY